MSSHTATDPLYGDLVVALLVVLSVLTLGVAVDSAIRVLQRRWRAANARLDLVLADGLAEIDFDRWGAELTRQRAEAAAMASCPPAQRCLHLNGPWICIAAPHPHSPARHYYVKKDLRAS